MTDAPSRSQPDIDVATGDIVRRLRHFGKLFGYDIKPLFDDATDRIEELTKALEWQPIETAPRDGTSIFLWAESWDMTWGMQVGHFEFGEWHTSEGSVADNDEDFDPHAEVFDESALDDLDANTGPTNWMPLPKVPSLSLEDRKRPTILTI